jgi:hypothetical protein
MNKSQLVSNYRNLKQRFLELRYRAAHAFNLFRMRFLKLIVSTHVVLPIEFQFNTKLASPRGRMDPEGKKYSMGYELDLLDLPNGIRTELIKLNSIIRLYFGGDYLINTPTIWRNIGIQKKYQSLDIYSQVWHYDKVFDYRNLQLFILLSDVTLDDGPLEWLPGADERLIHSDAMNRNTTSLTENQEIQRLIGNRGDALLLSTGSIPHRAGIPAPGRQRDILSIAFFPTYSNIGMDAKQLLIK